MRSIIIISAIFFTSLIFTSCENPIFENSTETIESNFEIGQEFSLDYHSTSFNEDEDIKVRFADIEESRCATNVTCVWAGNAKSAFKLDIKGKAFEIALNSHPNLEKSTIIKGYSIQLINVAPYPESAETLAPKKDYTVKLKIDKAP
jgi:hypothetical protein